MRPRDLAVVCAVALMAALAIVLGCTVATTQGYVKPKVAHAYSPFTVEVEVWDTGANPWDHVERPLRRV